jgi:hypothetical protein
LNAGNVLGAEDNKPILKMGSNNFWICKNTMRNHPDQMSQRSYTGEGDILIWLHGHGS